MYCRKYYIGFGFKCVFDLLSLGRDHGQDVVAVQLFSLISNIVRLQGELQPGDGVEALPEVWLHRLRVACLCQDLKQLVIGQEVEPDGVIVCIKCVKPPPFLFARFSLLYGYILFIY